MNWLILFGHFNITSPLFSGIVNAWVSFIGAEQAEAFNHYPSHLILLPYYFGWAKIISGVLFETITLGLVALLFARIEERFGNLPKSIWAGTLSKLPHLMVVWIILNGLILLVAMFLPQFAMPYVEGSPRRQMLLEILLMPGLYILIMAPLFIAIPAVVVGGKSVFSAIKTSLRLFRERYVTMFLLTLLVLVIPVFFSLITSRPLVIVEKFKPELVYWILLAGLFADMFVKFFWMGTAVKLLSLDDDH